MLGKSLPKQELAAQLHQGAVGSAQGVGENTARLATPTSLLAQPQGAQTLVVAKSTLYRTGMNFDLKRL